LFKQQQTRGKDMQAKVKVWYTRQEAAEYLGYSSSTLDGWASTGRHELPYYRRGKRVFYRIADLDDFMESQRQVKA
jgi:excisionase family DNA binding protein